DHRVAVVDGIVGCAAPEVVRRAAAAGTRVHLLVHMPLAAEPGLGAETRRRRQDAETRALRHAAGILCPSRTAATELRARGFAATVAIPGVLPAAPATGS
ncbi:glycosyltransferase, partial [Georgenia sp. 10Sc9-8]|nr:glycosyltransferase [Georgenia halotolerans]